MIEEKDTYTKEEVKYILADLIESIGDDSAAVCAWNGVNSISVDEWRKSLYDAMNKFHKYGESQAYFNIARYAQNHIKNENKIQDLGQA